MKKNTKIVDVEIAEAEGYIGPANKVVIDKLSITLVHPNLLMPDSTLNGGSVNYEKLIRKGMEDLIAYGYALNKPYGMKKQGYYFTFQQELQHTDDTPAIWLIHNKGTKCFLRIEFNPIKCGPLGITQLAEFFETLFQGFWALILKHGKVTRVDAAIDLWGTDIEQVWPVQSNALQSATWSRQGRLKTLCIGSPKSSQLKAYDKLSELDIKHTQPITRVEYKWLGHWPLLQLHKFPNPFLNVAVLPIIPPKPNWAKPSDWMMFCDSVKVRGPEAAIAGLTQHYRKKYRAHFKSHAIPFWQPEKFWASWPKASAYVQAGGYHLTEFQQVA